MKFGKFNSVLDMLYEYEIENILSIIALYPCILLLFGWKNQKKNFQRKNTFRSISSAWLSSLKGSNVT